MWLPAVCRKMDIPYCIVKSKSRLGALVHKKTATALALTAVNNEDKATLSKLVDSLDVHFSGNEKLRREWGGGIMGSKSQHKTRARAKLLAKEAAQRADDDRDQGVDRGGARAQLSYRLCTVTSAVRDGCAVVRDHAVACAREACACHCASAVGEWSRYALSDSVYCIEQRRVSEF